MLSFEVVWVVFAGFLDGSWILFQIILKNNLWKSINMRTDILIIQSQEPGPPIIYDKMLRANHMTETSSSSLFILLRPWGYVMPFAESDVWLYQYSYLRFASHCHQILYQ